MAPSEDEKALAIALVRAHVMDNIENMSWVPAYTKVRWANTQDACVTEWVGGHWRRKAHCKRTIDALACVCKQPELATPERFMPPVGRKRNR
jgi:hypothetical protein